MWPYLCRLICVCRKTRSPRTMMLLVFIRSDLMIFGGYQRLGGEVYDMDAFVARQGCQLGPLCRLWPMERIWRYTLE